MSSSFVEKVNPNDPENLLDPRVSQGEEGIARILEYLDANEDIVNNPRVAELLKRKCERIFLQSGISAREPETKEKNLRRVEAIKACRILTGEELEQKIDSMTITESYDGISIDKRTVTCQTLSNFSGDPKLDYRIEFSVDEKGNIIQKGRAFHIIKSGLHMLVSEDQRVFDENGICMQQDEIQYRTVNGVRKRESTTRKRDLECPLIACEEVVTSDGKSELSYYPIIKGAFEGLTPERDYPKMSRREDVKAYIMRTQRDIAEAFRKGRYNDAIEALLEQVGIPVNDMIR